MIKKKSMIIKNNANQMNSLNTNNFISHNCKKPYDFLFFWEMFWWLLYVFIILCFMI